MSEIGKLNPLNAGAMAANGVVEITATGVDNREQNGTKGTIDAQQIKLSATNFDNRGGAVRAAKDAQWNQADSEVFTVVIR